MRHGILYGITVARESLSPITTDLLARWFCGSQDKQVAFWRRYPRIPADHVRYRFVPVKVELVEGVFIGFRIATGTKNHGECPIRSMFRLADMGPGESLSEPLHRAERRWRRFSRWAKKNGVVLPKPSVWVL